MADVYKKAERVIVWLGNDDEFTTDALTTMRTISSIPERDWPLVPYISFYAPDKGQSYRHTTLMYHNWLGFITLVNRP